jgi:hypothetical protein
VVGELTDHCSSGRTENSHSLARKARAGVASDDSTLIGKLDDDSVSLCLPGEREKR